MLVTITTANDEVHFEAAIVDLSRYHSLGTPSRFPFTDGPRRLDLKLISPCDRFHALVGQHKWICVTRGARPPVWFDAAELVLVDSDHAVVSGSPFDSSSVTPRSVGD